jgi:hypothetical protein
MKKVIELFIVSFAFFSCDNINYAKGVHKDAERLFISHKTFFRSLAVNGMVSEKKYCEKCHFNKYQIIIALKEEKPEAIELGNLSYHPYYFFIGKSQLNISVTQQLYDSVKEGSLIEKKTQSDSIILGGQQYRLLSDKKSEWLPD